MDIQSSNSQFIQVCDLDKIGSRYSVVVTENYKNLGRNLKLNEIIKVSVNDEGSHLQFETLDKISVIVPVNSADGPFNKIE